MAKAMRTRPNHPENVDDCSSDSEPDDGDAVPAFGEAEHDGGQVDGCGGNWERDDDYAVDKRAAHGFRGEDGPRLNGLSDWQQDPFHSFDGGIAMTEEGAKKAAAGNTSFNACLSAAWGSHEVLGGAGERVRPAPPPVGALEARQERERREGQEVV
eukprot:6210505-Pleurochrysis_carterae.AAC.2